MRAAWIRRDPCRDRATVAAVPGVVRRQLVALLHLVVALRGAGGVVSKRQKRRAAGATLEYNRPNSTRLLEILQRSARPDSQPGSGAFS